MKQGSMNGGVSFLYWRVTRACADDGEGLYSSQVRYAHDASPRLADLAARPGLGKVDIIHLIRREWGLQGLTSALI